jgi:hypothetical protein
VNTLLDSVTSAGYNLRKIVKFSSLADADKETKNNNETYVYASILTLEGILDVLDDYMLNRYITLESASFYNFSKLYYDMYLKRDRAKIYNHKLNKLKNEMVDRQGVVMKLSSLSNTLHAAIYYSFDTAEAKQDINYLKLSALLQKISKRVSLMYRVYKTPYIMELCDKKIKSLYINEKIPSWSAIVSRSGDINMDKLTDMVKQHPVIKDCYVEVLQRIRGRLHGLS